MFCLSKEQFRAFMSNNSFWSGHSRRCTVADLSDMLLMENSPTNPKNARIGGWRPAKSRGVDQMSHRIQFMPIEFTPIATQ
jgi:hypothetical protein